MEPWADGTGRARNGRQAACPARPGPEAPARGEAAFKPVKKLLTDHSYEAPDRWGQIRRPPCRAVP